MTTPETTTTTTTATPADDELFIGPEVDLEDGTYEAELLGLETVELDVIDEKSGQAEQRSLWRLTFTIDVPDGEPVEVGALASRSTSPKSKIARWLIALAGPEAAEGRRYRRDELIGRRALAKVEHDANKFPKVADLMALPKGRGIPRSTDGPPDVAA